MLTTRMVGDFIAELDKFLGRLPKGWPYGVELRNRDWLRPDHFECLSRLTFPHRTNEKPGRIDRANPSTHVPCVGWSAVAYWLFLETTSAA